MSGLQQLFVDTVSSVTATKPAGYDVGIVRWEGAKQYAYAYNGGNSQIPPTYGCKIQSGCSNATVTISSTSQTDHIYGIVVNATLTTSAYGWVLRHGPVTFEADVESFSINSPIVTGSNGTFESASQLSSIASAAVGKLSIVGYSTEAIASGASGVGWFNFL